jgi:hypothetical protein
MRTLVLDRHQLVRESGRFATHAPARHMAPPMPIDAFDPALAALDPLRDPDASFATWQEDAMPASLASQVVRALPSPARVAPSAPPPPVVATLSPDGTLLPWRHDPQPAASSRGGFLIGLVLVLAATLAALLGVSQRTPRAPAAIAVRIARSAASGVRDLVLADSADQKRPPMLAPAPHPVKRRVAPALPLPSAAPAASGAGESSVGDVPGEL